MKLEAGSSDVNIRGSEESVSPRWVVMTVPWQSRGAHGKSGNNGYGRMVNGFGLFASALRAALERGGFTTGRALLGSIAVCFIAEDTFFLAYCRYSNGNNGSRQERLDATDDIAHRIITKYFSKGSFKTQIQRLLLKNNFWFSHEDDIVTQHFPVTVYQSWQL